MNARCRFVCLCLVLELLLPTLVGAQKSSTTQPPTSPPVEILNFKVGTDYYPMLDSKPSTMSADNPDFPRPPNEIAARQSRRGGVAERNEEIKSRGKSRTTIQVISNAQWVNLAIKNTGTKAIKTIIWDFAFARVEEGKLALRYEVSNTVEVKPGARKNLKQPLPFGATRCQVLTVSADETKNEKARAFESVCGRGFNDPSQLKETQEPVTIKRIEYTDGSVWQPGQATPDPTKPTAIPNKEKL